MKNLKRELKKTKRAESRALKQGDLPVVAMHRHFINTLQKKLQQG